MLLSATLAPLDQLELLDRPEQMEPTAPPERPDLLALREPTESMERPDPLAPLVPREPTEQTVQMELTERLGQQVRRARPEQPVSYRASPPLVFSSPTRTARPRLPQARSSC